MARLLLVGDVHGRLDLLVGLVERAFWQHGAVACLQAGDLSFTRAALGLRAALPRFAVPVHAICGNHDDHRWLHRAWTGAEGARWRACGLHWQPRGSLLEWEGCRIGCVGGALNIDRPQRGGQRRGDSTWLNEGQVAQALDAFQATPPDLILSHSCPAGIGIGMSGNPQLAQEVLEHVRWRGFDCGPDHDCGEPGLTALWQGLSTRPATWVFGHFHQLHRRCIAGCDFLSLPIIMQEGPMLLYDTELRGVVEV